VTRDNQRQRALLLAVGGVIASLALYLLFYRARGAWDYNFGHGYGRDFANFWAAGKLAALGETATLFDVDRYNAFLRAALSNPIDGGMVYSYPPTLVALLLPFGVLPYPVALAAWSLLSVAVLAITLRMIAPDARGAAMLVMAAPALGVAAFQGHPTAVWAALFTGALLLAPRRPVFAGILLGLLTLKPQLGVIAGLIMLIERRWQCMIAAAVTAAALLVLSLATVGVVGWQAYLGTSVPMHRDFLVTFTGGFTYFLTTPYAGFRALGLAHPIAMAAHTVVAAAIAVTVLQVWRRADDRTLALLIAALASVLVTPYANIYDLALAAPALAILAMREHAATSWLVLLWLAPAAALPVALIAGPVVGLVLAASVALLSHEVLSRHGSAKTHHREAASLT
jgi:hypothetical protein